MPEILQLFHLQIIGKLQAIGVKSSLSVNLRICTLEHGKRNIKSDRVKVVDFLPRSTNHLFLTADWGRKCGCFPMYGIECFCSGMVGQMDWGLLYIYFS